MYMVSFLLPIKVASTTDATTSVAGLLCLFMLSQQSQAFYSGQQGITFLAFLYLTFVHATFG
jgi:hypothetical protein